MEKSNSNKFSTTTIDKNFTRIPFQDTLYKNPDKQNRQKSHAKDKDKETLILPKIDVYHTSKRSISLHNNKLQNNKNKKPQSKVAKDK